MTATATTATTTTTTTTTPTTTATTAAKTTTTTATTTATATTTNRTKVMTSMITMKMEPCQPIAEMLLFDGAGQGSLRLALYCSGDLSLSSRRRSPQLV